MRLQWNGKGCQLRENLRQKLITQIKRLSFQSVFPGFKCGQKELFVPTIFISFHLLRVLHSCLSTEEYFINKVLRND